MTDYIDNLQQALRDAAAREYPVQHSSPRRSWVSWRPHAGTRARRPLALTAGVLALLAAAAVVVVLLLGASATTQPAYALTRDANGTMTVTIRDVATAIPALNAEFQQRGIATRVIPIKTDCPVRTRDGDPTLLPNPQSEYNGAITITLSATYQQRRPANPGSHYILAAKQLPNGKLLAYIGQIHGPIPPCLRYSGTPSNIP